MIPYHTSLHYTSLHYTPLHCTTQGMLAKNIMCLKRKAKAKLPPSTSADKEFAFCPASFVLPGMVSCVCMCVCGVCVYAMPPLTCLSAHYYVPLSHVRKLSHTHMHHTHMHTHTHTCTLTHTCTTHTYTTLTLTQSLAFSL
jgi:hypothetical protein